MPINDSSPCRWEYGNAKLKSVSQKLTLLTERDFCCFSSLCNCCKPLVNFHSFRKANSHDFSASIMLLLCSRGFSEVLYYFHWCHFFHLNVVPLEHLLKVNYWSWIMKSQCQDVTLTNHFIILYIYNFLKYPPARPGGAFNPSTRRQRQVNHLSLSPVWST